MYMPILISVWLWNFKDGGPKKQDFWPRINILKGNLKKENPSMNYGSSKSAKIVLSKSIFEVKNQLILQKRLECPKIDGIHLTISI